MDLDATARDAFVFLIAEYGFHEVGDVRGLAFESDRAIVQLVYDPRGELEVYVGRVGDDAVFTLSEIAAALQFPQEAGPFTWISATERIPDGIRHLAGVLRAHGHELLIGEAQAFERVAADARAASDELTQYYEGKGTRPT